MSENITKVSETYRFNLIDGMYVEMSVSHADGDENAYVHAELKSSYPGHEINDRKIQPTFFVPWNQPDDRMLEQAAKTAKMRIIETLSGRIHDEREASGSRIYRMERAIFDIIECDPDSVKPICEEIKQSVASHGREAIEDLLGYAIDPTESVTAIEPRMDEVLAQMPMEDIKLYYRKYCQ